MNKLLVANRGEIAVRIMRSCQKMGIDTVAVFSGADAGAPFVKMADEAVSLGGNQAAGSYLSIEKIIAAAQRVNADAIHPGYGFLAENAAFAQACADAGITFVGPHPQAIEAMGSKIKAKQLMRHHAVPVVPGYDGEDQSMEKLQAEAEKIGYPVLLKAALGGGGKGMRVVRQAGGFAAAAAAARREAKAAFGDDALLIEKYFDSARHIEFQIMGDKHGNIVHLFERECSIQRRHQKVIEETPSPALNDALRRQMAEAALKAAAAINYDNAGTVEFILAPSGEFYFLEVNTRLQVEHPVTEMTTGLDLVQMQIMSAIGQPLGISQGDIAQSGHAIECRLYAEDPANGFLPETGRVLLWKPQQMPGLRYDAGVETGSEISVFYDPMIAKVVAHAPSRELAIGKMKKALRATALLGLAGNKNFLLGVLQHPDFAKGDFDTHFLGKVYEYKPAPQAENRQLGAFAAAAVLWLWNGRQAGRKMLRQVPSGWRNNPFRPQMEVFVVEGGEVECAYRHAGDGRFEMHVGGRRHNAGLVSVHASGLCVEVDSHRLAFDLAETEADLWLHNPVYGSMCFGKVSPFPPPDDGQLKGGYAAPMPGEVVKVLVKAGDSVKAGEGLLILSSMKMENMVEAQQDGTVEEVFVEAGAFVEADTLLLKLAGPD